MPSYVDSAMNENFAIPSGTILLADATDTDWQRAEELVAPLEGAISLQAARLTEAEEGELFETARERLRWIKESGRSMALAWAASEDRFTVVVGGTTDPLSDADRRQIEADLADLATNILVREGPASFEEEHTGDCAADPTKTGGWTEGGRRINPCGAIASHNCTAGFSVRTESSNPVRTGVLTAAHCNGFDNNTGQWWYISLADGETPFSTVRYANHEDYDHGDIMFVREWFGSALARPVVYREGQTWTTITSFQWENPLNTTIVVKGGQTAYDVNHLWANMVGHIEDNLVEVETNGQAPAGNFYYAAGDYGNGACCQGQLSPRPGDSGSAVWVLATREALGIHKGGDPGFEVYSKVGYALNDMNLEILTSER